MWTLVLWYTVGSLAGVVLPVFFAVEGTADGWWALTGIFGMAMVALLLVLGARTPAWLIVTLALVGVTASVMATHAADSDYGILQAALSLFWVVLYVALWGPPLAALGSVVVCSAAFLISVIAHGYWQELGFAWALITITWASIVAAVNYHVRDLDHGARFDALTGVLNRNGLDEWIRLHPAAGRATTPRSVVVLDLDDFKAVNDRDGHAAGDRMLRDLADHLRHSLRPDDLVVRIGGDEFVLLLPQTPAEVVPALMDRLRQKPPSEWSYGACSWQPGEAFDAAFRRADELMYISKRVRHTGRQG